MGLYGPAVGADRAGVIGPPTPVRYTWLGRRCWRRTVRRRCGARAGGSLR
jgi:hypothetical protein